MRGKIFERKVALGLIVSFLILGGKVYADPTVQELSDKIENKLNSDKVEIGKNANTNSEDSGIAIGKDANINNAGGTGSKPKGAIAIGEGSTVHNYIDQSGGIAIGQNAYAESMIGRQEKAFAFNKDIIYGGFLGLGSVPKNEYDHLMTTLVIGNNTYARSGGIMIGPHNFRGKMGDIDNISTDTKEEKVKLGVGVLATTLGTNSFTNGAFASTTGAYSIITSRYDGKDFNSLYASQNFGAVINGSLNSIESYKSDSSYSGIANSIVGLANRTSNSNGSLIFGAGNEITNSIEDVSLSTSKLNSPNDLTEKLRKIISDKKGAGATLAIGGANKADYTKQVSMIGTRNEIRGTKGKETKLVSITGDNNLVENSRNIVDGNNFYVTGNGNVLQGFNNIEDKKGFLEDEYNYVENIRKEKLAEAQKKLDKAQQNLDKATAENNAANIFIYKKQVEKAQKEVENYKNETPKDEYKNKTIKNFVSNNNVVAFGNDIKVSTDDSVYLGRGSANSKDENTLWRANKQFDATYNQYAGFNNIGGIVSVGSPELTRIIQNVGPGLISATSTDAINGSQLYNYIAKQYITLKDGKGNSTKIRLGDTLTLNGTTVSVTIKAPEKSVESENSTPAPVPQPIPMPQPTPQPKDETSKTEEHTVTFETDYYKKPEVDQMSANALSGVANAVAMANLPQVSSYNDYRHIVSAAYGNYLGQSAISVGLSGISKNNRVIYRLSGSLNTRGKVALGAGIGVMIGKVKTPTIELPTSIKEKLEKSEKERKEIQEQLLEQKEVTNKQKEMLDKQESKINDLYNIINELQKQLKKR